MKYTINGYSQEKLIEYEVDLSTSLILRVIADMYTSNSDSLEYKIIDDDKYMWCTYGYLLKQIPIIGVEKTIVRKIDSLIEKGILKKKVLFQRKGKTGKYIYVSLGEKYSSLTEYGTTDKKSLEQQTNCPDTTDKMSFDQQTNCPIKDSSISDYSIIDSLREKEEGQDDTPKETENIGMYFQEIKMLLSGYNINFEKIARMGKPIERIKAVIKFAKENKKGEGWIVGAIKDDYKLEVYKSNSGKSKAITESDLKYEKNDDTEKLYEILGL